MKIYYINADSYLEWRILKVHMTFLEVDIFFFMVDRKTGNFRVVYAEMISSWWCRKDDYVTKALIYSFIHPFFKHLLETC